MKNCHHPNGGSKPYVCSMTDHFLFAGFVFKNHGVKWNNKIMLQLEEILNFLTTFSKTVFENNIEKWFTIVFRNKFGLFLIKVLYTYAYCKSFHSILRFFNCCSKNSTKIIEKTSKLF